MPTRIFHWDPVNDCVTHETDGSGNTTVVYTHEPGPFGPLLSENRGGTEYYHHYDALGSTTFLTDDTGAVTDTFVYDAWGNTVARAGTTPTPYQWVGRWGYQFDTPTRGFHIRARSYQPTVARWTSVGPVFLASELHPYTAFSNSPSVHFDPSGMLARLPLSIEATNAVTKRCRRILVDWNISVKQEKLVKYDLIAQKLRNERYRQTCDNVLNDTGELCCTYNDDSCHGGCTVYEFLAVIAFNEKDRIIRGIADPEIVLNSLVDRWRYPQIGPTCSEKGSKDIEGDVRGFVDNFLDKYNEINGLRNGWQEPGSIACDCAGESLTNFGSFKVGDAPSWWNEHRYEGDNFATVDYNCCRSPYNTMSYASNSTGAFVIHD